MRRLRRKCVSCFAYFSLIMFLMVLLIFVMMDKSSTNVVIFDGPELFHAYHQQVGMMTHAPITFPIPKPDLGTPQLPRQDLPYPDLLVNPQKPSFNCAKLFDNDLKELRKAKDYMNSHNNSFTHRRDSIFDLLTRNCDRFKQLRGYPSEPSTEAERNFPLAFNILMYQNVEQLERLLRVIYAPQNQYCIHVDKKAAPIVLKAVLGIASCFDNVFVASTLETVVYASFKRLQADINCMRDHVKRTSDWKYLINMASSEFPIQSNFQFVQTLILYNGANDIHEVFSTLDAKRFRQKYVTYLDTDIAYIVNTNLSKEEPPHKLTITKGNAYNVFSRKFVEFALENKIAQDLLDWSRDTYTPDEHYWATLNNLYSNPFLKSPGGCRANPERKSYFARYIGWKRSNRCKAGHYIHNICVFSVEDLPMLRQRHEMIANKFNIDYDPVAFSCMEEWLNNKTRDQTEINRVFERHYKKIALQSGA